MPYNPFDFPQNFNTNCPGLQAIRRCKNIGEKFNLLEGATTLQTTDARLMP